MSVAYETYKKAVDGKTMTGEDMKELSQLPEKIQYAWCSIDKHYTEKPEITESATYELYKSKNKEAKEFSDLPDSIKRTWASLDKNSNKFIKQKEVKPRQPKAVKPKQQEQKPSQESKEVPEQKTKQLKAKVVKKNVIET